MTPDIHAQNRAWAFEALDRLQAFLDDSDFEGPPEEERDALVRARERLQESKYRVVFLGAFNVGKSTLINAYLGDEYLPRILQECTTKVTHVLQGDRLRALLPLSADATHEELQALRDFLAAAGAQTEVAREGRDIAIDFAGTNPGDLRNALNALITISSEEDFPRLASLRTKFEEVTAVVPNPRLPEDVDFVDSPGVHSIAETRRTMAEDVLPGSHLVVYLLDGQSAGNEQSREFIQNLVRHGKKVFFVLNKSDQLNPDEIDPLGHRGPARDLLRSIQGLAEHPEVFFVSSLYALLAEQLDKGRVTLESIDRDNKVKIPFALQRELLAGADPARGVADYLMAESRFALLRERLLEYLFGENEEGGVVYATARMVADKAWRYGRPLESRLEMARNVPRLAELRQERERLEATLARNRSTLDQTMEEYAVLSGGGEIGTYTYEGYEGLIERRLGAESVQAEVVRPVREWLENGESYTQAKKQRFRPVQADVEQRFEDLLERLTGDLNREADTAENRARMRIAPIVPHADELRARPVDAPHAGVAAPRTGLAKSYFGFSLIGAIVGAGAGAAVGVVTDLEQYVDMVALPDVAEPGGVIGAVAGAVAGFIVGLVARGSGSDDARRERLDTWLNRQAEQVLHTEAREQLLRNAERRRSEFAQTVQQSFDVINGELERRIAELREEEGQIERSQQEVVLRLEPKTAALAELSRTARAVAENRQLPAHIAVRPEPEPEPEEEREVVGEPEPAPAE